MRTLLHSMWETHDTYSTSLSFVTCFAGRLSSLLLGWWVGGGGDGLNLFYMFITLPLSSAVVYTSHLFSPSKRFLTHQYNISENIKIKRLQRGNNDEDSTARNKWNAVANENLQLNSGGPDQSQSIRHQPTFLKVIEYEALPADV